MPEDVDLRIRNVELSNVSEIIGVPLSDVVSSIVKPSTGRIGETIGLALNVYLEPLNERLRIAAKERTERVLAQAAKRLEERKSDPALLVDAPPELLTAVIVANASSVDAPELQTMFAGLLATAALRSAGAPRPWITEVLRQLDGPSARLLAVLHEHSFLPADGPTSAVSTTRPDGRVIRRESPPTISGPAVEGRGDIRQLSEAIPLLMRLALIEVEKGTWGEPTPMPGGGFQQVDIRPRVELRLSEFGIELCTVCLA